MSLRAKPGCHLLQINHTLARLLLCNASCNLAHERGDLAFGVANTSFARVVSNQVHERLVGDRHLRLLQAVILSLLWDDVALCNLYLLDLGVPRNLNDFHAIAERRRDRVELIRSCNEEHLRKVELHLKIIVLIRRVLLWIKHLKERRRRIAAEVRAELVDLIKHEDRVLCSRLLDSLHDATRKRTDVGAPVAADLCLVMKSTEAHAYKFPSHRSRDRLTE